MSINIDYLFTTLLLGIAGYAILLILVLIEYSGGC